jgi:ABC-2 type transport system permease protein
LQSIVTTAVQVSVVHERAASAGIDQETAATVLAPIPLTNTVIGIVAGRDADDETAAALVTVVLLAAILVYGNLVLSGVAEEKSSRVVEVLLARLPAKALLGGKVVGIGLLGLAQLTLTAVAALVAALAVDSVEPPTVTDGVLAWVIVWFALGYALYAMVYGALGSLASRTEDAQSVAGPVGYLMVAGYWASFVAIGQDPDGPWSRLLSLLPVTAPLAMPGRIALGVTSWWEPLLAAVLTLVAIAALVAVAGRVYENAILHTGARLRLRDTWHGAHDAEPRTDPAERHRASATVWAVVIGAAGLGTSAAVFVLTHDVVWSLVPLLLAIAALRATLHRGDDKPV